MHGKHTAGRTDVYAEVTDSIIARLEQGTIPWRKPWSSRVAAGDGIPRNFNSGRPYRGINVFLLAMQPYASPFWVTFKGAQAAGGTVRRGERSTLVVFWKPLAISDTDPATGAERTRTVPMLKHYRVFNVEQCDGIELPAVGATPEFDPLEQCETVLGEMPCRPEIAYGGDRAYYQPATDRVQLPPRKAFPTAEGFYETAFHELAHSTGHPSRLNRDDLVKTAGFGTQTYSREELVAEMTAAMLCGHCGISPQTLDNSAAYIQGWLSKLRDDRKLLVVAAARAQKAADYILGATDAPSGGEA